MSNLFQCPDCLSSLRRLKQTYICSKCKNVWEIIDEIPVFLQDIKSYARDHLKEDQYMSFFNNLKTMSWDEAIKKLTEREDINKAWKIPYFLSDRKRNDFIFLLPINKQSVVLDYGSGWGNTSFTLSDFCKEVYSMEADFSRLRFSSKHFRHRNKKNIIPLCSSASTHLPFSKEMFDIVILNGVLEWTPLFIEGKPINVHKKVLNEIYRVLKPDGTIFISIENRYGYQYFFGKKDNHSGGLRWVTFLPRIIANFYSRLKLRKDYRTWFYSYNKLKKVIKQSGFYSIEMYSYYPNHVRYSYVFSIDNIKLLWNSLKYIIANYKLSIKEKFLLNLLGKIGIFKFFTQDFMVIAKKNNK